MASEPGPPKHREQGLTRYHIISLGPDTAVIASIKHEIQSHFDIEDLGPVNYLLEMRVRREGNAFHLDQQAMIERAVEKYKIEGKINTPCSVNARYLKPTTDEESNYLVIFRNQQYIVLT